jgi:hypothetical protein
MSAIRSLSRVKRTYVGHGRTDAVDPERTCSWRKCVTMFTEEVAWLSPGEKELIMGRAVCDWLGGNLAS